MLSSIDAHQKGLDAGMEIAREKLSEILGVQCENLGHAFAEVIRLKRKYEWMQQDLAAMQTQRSDWK